VRNVARVLVGVAVIAAGVALISRGVRVAERDETRSKRSTTVEVETKPNVERTPQATSRLPAIPRTTGRSDSELAQDARIRGIFAPFADAGVMNFVRGHYELVETDARRPISYRWARAAGRLATVDDFLSVASDPANDRPHWPPIESAADREAATALFSLYQRLAPIWERP
jgi:hypothetical protein